MPWSCWPSDSAECVRLRKGGFRAYVNHLTIESDVWCSGKRQVEEQRRAQQDAVFREMVKVHQATVDTYLEDIILAAQAATADQQGIYMHASCYLSYAHVCLLLPD